MSLCEPRPYFSPSPFFEIRLSFSGFLCLFLSLSLYLSLPPSHKTLKQKYSKKKKNTPGGFFVGFPLEALGAASLFYIVPKYVLDKKDFMADAGEVVKDVAKRLPGL